MNKQWTPPSQRQGHLFVDGRCSRCGWFDLSPERNLDCNYVKNINLLPEAACADRRQGRVVWLTEAEYKQITTGNRAMVLSRAYESIKFANGCLRRPQKGLALYGRGERKVD